MSLQALGIAKLFATETAFEVLRTRVNGLVFGEVERLSEVFPTNITVERLLTSVHSLVATEGFTSAETTATRDANVWSLSFTTRPTRITASTFDGNFTRLQLSLLPGLSGALGLAIGVV